MKALIERIKSLKAMIEKENEEWKKTEPDFQQTQREIAIDIKLKLTPEERKIIRDMSDGYSNHDHINKIMELMEEGK